MNSLIDIAKMYNIILAKIQHSPLPVTVRELNEMVELAHEAPLRIRDSLKQLHKTGKIIKVPVSSLVDKRERVGYQWNNKTHTTASAAMLAQTKPKVMDDLRIKVNDDHSVTIITKAIRITIEVPQ